MTATNRILRWILTLALIGDAYMALAKSPTPPPPPAPPKGPIEYLQSLAPWTTVEQPADFVRESRPEHKDDFIPGGSVPFVSDLKVRSAAELEAAKQEMEAARTVHDAIKAQPPVLTAAPPPPPPPPATASKPTKKVVKRKSRIRAAATTPQN